MIELLKEEKERAILVGLVTRAVHRRQAEEYIEELALLADTAGAVVVRQIVQERDRIDSAYYIGKGKANEIAGLVEDENIVVVIFDDDLSPAQLRNLETLIKRKIVDRSGLILDIFASRARTNEARTQVELAQLQYLLPRLTRQWTHLSKQYGGIRTKGPGETQIETDRRMVRARISRLKQTLEGIKRARATQRKNRTSFPTAALVGYTNAGKSTLMNSLADASVFVEDRLFATLDTTTRLVDLAGAGRVLLSDTVGFIRKLPHHLIASFTSTLEEVVEADLLLHVVDLSHPQFEDHIRVVSETLELLGAGSTPIIFVFNKIDAVSDRSVVQELHSRYSNSVFVSARRGINILGLQESIAEILKEEGEDLSVSLPIGEQKTLSAMYAVATVRQKVYEEESIRIELHVAKNNRQALNQLIAAGRGKIVTAQKL